ncbi:MAG: hypothetical protein AB7I50_26475, partial [Vicinamibacterales bacterium]
MTAEADQRLTVTLAHERAAWDAAERQTIEQLSREADERLRQRETEIRDDERRASMQAREALESAFDIRLHDTLEQHRRASQEELDRS